MDPIGIGLQEKEHGVSKRHFRFFQLSEIVTQIFDTLSWCPCPHFQNTSIFLDQD